MLLFSFVFGGFVLFLRQDLSHMVEAGLDPLVVLVLFLKCWSYRHPPPCQLAFENTLISSEVTEESPVKECVTSHIFPVCITKCAQFLSF